MNPDYADHDDDMPRAVEHALLKHNALGDELCRVVAGEVWQRMQADYNGLYELWREQAINMRALESERDRLRKAIEQAPHTSICKILGGDDDDPCCCWKRAALEGKP
jgi:hypothetical protein